MYTDISYQKILHEDTENILWFSIVKLIFINTLMKYVLKIKLKLKVHALLIMIFLEPQNLGHVVS